MKPRFLILLFLFAGMYGLLGTKLYRLQITKSEYYANEANAKRERAELLELRRGQIFATDRAGGTIPLALNKDYPIIFVSPSEVKNEDGLLNIVPDGLGISADMLRLALKDKKSSYKLLVEKASDSQISFVSENKLEGVHIDTKQYRAYPFEYLASQLIGFVGYTDARSDPVGLYGIEKLHDDFLTEGGSVKLTIDRNIQAHAEEVLSGLIEKFGAVGGSIVVEEPETGRIIALASNPDFDPNDYGSYPLKNFLNPAIQLVYEPGSVMKPITMAAGINSGAFTPETSYVDSGSITLNGKTIRNANDKVYGRITMTEVIENSVNTGAVFAEKQIGHAAFVGYLEKFGFGEKTGIDAPDEISSSLKNLKRKSAREVDFATASFGQGVAVTPVQLANAFSVIANGGLLMKPYVNQDSKPYVVRRVISEETAKSVTKMMESAVVKAGIASISEYRVAGKTGTAYIPDFKKGGYSEEMEHTFVGFAPASEPVFVVLIKIDKPQVGELAGLTVVPAFKNMAQFILNYYNVPPDKLSDNQKL